MRIIFDLTPTVDGYSARMQSPDQSEQWIDATTASMRNDTLTITIAPIGFSYIGKFNGLTIEGAFTQMGRTFEMDLTREEIVQHRPQEPKPKYPYDIEDVVFRNEQAGIDLAGTLTLPWVGEKPFPVVVLVSGSGPQDRDESVAGHKPFWIIADRLTQQGIAVLRYDDRGVGQSGGNYATATVDDLADDAHAATAYIRKRFSPASVGVIGHSEGGWVALKLAAEKKTDFIVTLAAPGVDGKELMNMQRSALMKASGMPDVFIDAYNQKMNEAVEAALAVENQNELRDTITALLTGTPLESGIETAVIQLSLPEMRSFLQTDPALFWSNISCPVLALNGEKDLQVPAGPNLEAIRSGLMHNPQVTTKSYPALNHLFQTATTGLPTEYKTIEETFHDPVIQEIAEWILETCRRDHQ